VDGARSILGRPLSDLELDRHQKYLNMLIKWQRIHRLLGSVEPDWIIENVLLDSLLFVKVLPYGSAEILDLGAGAGIPGIPLAIVLPHARLTLVEARQRRASFLSSTLRELGLGNARLLHARLAVDAIPRELSQAFDAVVMRCAGDPAEVIPIGLQLAKPGGVVIASGPPRPRPLPSGEWVEVPGITPGSKRRFAVIQSPNRLSPGLP
jgi:16S rRNA (guanine527-N7)-methyltransferase